MTSPAHGSGFAADLRGLSAELLITIAGLATSAAIVALNFALRRGLDLDLLALTFLVVFPVGAFVGGIAAASGYYMAARATHMLPNRRMLFEMLAITLSTWFLSQWLSYALLRFPNGALVRDVVPFWDYFRVRTEHLQISFQSHGSETGRSADLGGWGYVGELIQIAGYLLGGLLMWHGLTRLEACTPCGRYARTQPVLKRATSAAFEELLQRANLVLPQLAERVRTAVGAKRLVGLNLNLVQCPSCHRHWIRPEAVVMDGAHPTVSAIPSYDIDRHQALQLGRLAPGT